MFYNELFYELNCSLYLCYTFAYNRFFLEVSLKFMVNFHYSFIWVMAKDWMNVQRANSLCYIVFYNHGDS